MHKLGIDLGGTTVKGALFDEKNRIIAESAVPTRGREGRDAIFSSLFALVDELKTEDTTFIGVSSAGNIDPVKGVCVYATENLSGWTGADIRSGIEKRYGLDCRVDNDAVCALKGELAFYPEQRDVTLLTFGTGVGGASLVNGRIVRGSRFDAARWGHLCLSAYGRRCNCGRRGCAETYLSATALLREGRKKKKSLESCKALFECRARGERFAAETLDTFGKYLNVLLDDIRTAVAPELIIIGGGVAESREIIRGEIKDFSDVAFARLGNRAGVYGAVSDLF